MKKHQIVIVGGGNAGLALTAQLLLKNPRLDIAIIEPSQKHYYQPAWTLVGAGEFDIQDTVQQEADYIPKGATWIQDAVSHFQPEENQLTCTSGATYSYDYLVVAPGIQLDWKLIEGARESVGKNKVSSNYLFETAPYTWELIRNFKGGTAIFTNPSSPIKCGGAPHKIMYLACDYWSKNGVLDKTEVHYVSGASMIFGVPEYAATLKEVLKKFNIKTHFLSNVYQIDGEKSKLRFRSKEGEATAKENLKSIAAACYSIEETNGEEIEVEMEFDFCHVVPPQSAPDFVKNSPLADANNAFGYVEVDKHTFRHTRYDNVFAFGDASNAPCSKTGAAIRKQTPVVVAQLLAQINQKTSDAQYDGYSACPIPTQYGKLMLAEFDYANKPKMTFPFDQAKPRWTMWLMKKHLLPWLYWHKILKGKA